MIYGTDPSVFRRLNSIFLEQAIFFASDSRKKSVIISHGADIPIEVFLHNVFNRNGVLNKRGVTRMRKPNTQRMEETLKYITEYNETNDRMPSFRTIKDACSYKSMNTLFADIERLKEAGSLIVDKENRLRLPLSEKSRRRSATMVGGIRCGTPSDATVEDSETVELPAVLFGEDLNRVIMKAEGDSMIGLGIHDGDWLIVYLQDIPEGCGRILP